MKPPVPDAIETVKILALVRSMPLNIGNHKLFGLYKADGGTASWKSFRRGVALCRGGAEARAEAARIEEEEERTERAEIARREQEWDRERKREQAAEREKRKEEEKMARREELSPGQSVFVKVMYAGHLKLRPAVVKTVMRGAVNVQIADEQAPRTVRFNEVETSAEVAQQRMQVQSHQPQHPQVEYRRPQQRDERDGPLIVGAPKAAGAPLTAVPPAFAALGRPQTPEPPKVVVPPPHTVSGTAEGPGVRIPAAQPEDTLSKVSAWIEQGTAMRENLVKQQALLQTQMDDLALEALRIEEALGGKRAELARLTTLLTALDQMRAVAA